MSPLHFKDVFRFGGKVRLLTKSEFDEHSFISEFVDMVEKFWKEWRKRGATVESLRRALNYCIFVLDLEKRCDG